MTVELLGIPIDSVSERDTVRRVIRGIEDGCGGWICPVNLDVLRQLKRSAEVRSLVEDADLLVADGMPLIWASRLQGQPLPERVAGSSLIETLPRAAAAAQASVFLVGGDPGAAEEAADRLRASNPGLRIAGVLCPPVGFEHVPAELAAIETELLRTLPDIVFVGLGFPKQERLVRRLRAVLPRAWFVSCGISFSFVSGRVARAPGWLQRAGLEWLHRLAQEPRRLFRRYVLQGFPFMAHVVARALIYRLRGAQSVWPRYRT